MIKSILIISVLALTQTVLGQLTPYPGKPRLEPFSEKEILKEEDNKNCIHKLTLNELQRLKFYPFNIAKEIKLISFGDRDSDEIGGRLPIDNGQINYNEAREVISLSKSQIDSLTDIMYNFGYKGIFHTYGKRHCYAPRNAILFIDSNSKIFAFIELCFQCDGFRISSEKVKTGDFCNQKYQMLKDFFYRNGVSYGASGEY
jgi:hypothetical protein